MFTISTGEGLRSQVVCMLNVCEDCYNYIAEWKQQSRIIIIRHNSQKYNQSIVNCLLKECDM